MEAALQWLLYNLFCYQGALRWKVKRPGGHWHEDLNSKNFSL